MIVRSPLQKRVKSLIITQLYSKLRIQLGIFQKEFLYEGVQTKKIYGKTI